MFLIIFRAGVYGVTLVSKLLCKIYSAFKHDFVRLLKNRSLFNLKLKVYAGKNLFILT